MMSNMKALLAMVLLAAPALGQASEAIKAKDGAACAASFDDVEQCRH